MAKARWRQGHEGRRAFVIDDDCTDERAAWRCVCVLRALFLRGKAEAGSARNNDQLLERCAHKLLSVWGRVWFGEGYNTALDGSLFLRVTVLLMTDSACR